MPANDTSPVVLWQYALDADWQPFPLTASAAVEAAYRAWRKGGSADAAVQSGTVNYAVDFELMLQWNGLSGRARAIRREEFFTAEVVASLRSELASLRSEVETLLAERSLSFGGNIAPGAELTARLDAPVFKAADSWLEVSSVSAGATVTVAGEPQRERGCVFVPIEPSGVVELSCFSGGLAVGEAVFVEAQGSLQPAEIEELRTNGVCKVSCQNVKKRKVVTQEQVFKRAALHSLAVLPRHKLWRSLDVLADRIFALPSYKVDPMLGFERTPLTDGDPRAQWLTTHFLSSFRPHRSNLGAARWCQKAQIEIMEISELYNEAVTRAYRQELAELRAVHAKDCRTVPELEGAIHVRTDLGGPRLNEVLLFHGCPAKALLDICRYGFDPRLGGTATGACFGIGSYFATAASKSDYYTTTCPEPSMKDCRLLLIARVALGAIHEARTAEPSLRRPPPGADGRCFDSVMGVPRTRGGGLDHDEFVIYKPAQAVAQFVVRYRHKGTCKCRTCLCPRPG